MSVLNKKAQTNLWFASKLDINELNYRGEGNLSLVVSLKSLNKVIRISKIKKEQEDVDLNLLKERLLNEISFSWNVMNKLFKPNIWISQYSLIELSKQQMNQIKDKVEHLRPDFRRSKTLPSQNYLALLIDDYCNFEIEQLELIKKDFPTYQLIGPVYSIEIKPKQAFMLPELNKLSVCKFRLRQQEKLSLSLIDKPSNYCPIDLFSGNEERIRFALNSLIDNPQNNFRLFIDKEFVQINNWLDCIQSQLNSNLNFNDLNKAKLIDLLISVLNHSFDLEPNDGNIKSNGISDHLEQICKYHTDIHQLTGSKQLNPNSILESIRNVQKLDEIGSKKAYELYEQFKSKYESQFDEWINETENSTELLDLTDKCDETERLKQQLTKFLYSLTAKDCSILITFQKVRNVSIVDEQNCKNFRYHSKRQCLYQNKTDKSIYLYTLALVDLDRKQQDKIEKTYQSDQKRIQEFIKTL